MPLAYGERDLARVTAGILVHRDSAGVPAPSWYSSRTRWPGDFGAIIDTSMFAGRSSVPNRTLKPCANISVLPALRFGRIASR